MTSQGSNYQLSEETERKIRERVEKFIENRGYDENEKTVQSNYTRKIFEECLGWDDTYFQEEETPLAGNRRRIDIRLHNGVPNGACTYLIVESKRPNVQNGLDGESGGELFCEQLKDYCRSEGVYWGVLTDFITWRIYHVESGQGVGIYQEGRLCSKDPVTGQYSVDIDDGMREILGKLQYAYIEHQRGKIDKRPLYYQIEGGQELEKKGFLMQLKAWRATLRAALSRFFDELDEANLETQNILDRLIFSKVCFDKDVIGINYLSSILHPAPGQTRYQRLNRAFRKLDDLFDTNLFFGTDLDNQLAVGNELEDVLERICREINRTRFRNLEVHIIGEAYEQYLAETLIEDDPNLSASEKAKRKKNGIFYTDKEIVDYMVQNTIGPALEAASSCDDLAGLKILDPACGSGSFLIGVFDAIYKRYAQILGNDIVRRGFAVKKGILKNNLFGVDIDSKAVQIAQLNLLLKALEFESDLSGHDLLPDLRLNIRHGNSIVFGDNNFDRSAFERQLERLRTKRASFASATTHSARNREFSGIVQLENEINVAFNAQLGDYFENVVDKLPFNFRVSFSEIFEANEGFDFVFANPPYGAELTAEDRVYIAEKYTGFDSLKNTATVFIERAESLVRPTGQSCYIVPKSLSYVDGWNNTRSYILNDRRLNFVIDVSEAFSGVLLEQVIINFSDNCQENYRFKVGDTLQVPARRLRSCTKAFAEQLDTLPCHVANYGQLFDKLNSEAVLLGTITNTFRGLGNSDLRKINQGSSPNTLVYPGINVQKYHLIPPDYREVTDSIALNNRTRGVFKVARLLGEKIISQNIVAHVRYPIEHIVINASLAVDTITKETVMNTIMTDADYDIRYILGLLNSKFAAWYYYYFVYNKAIRTMHFDEYYLGKLPIKQLDSGQQQEIIDLVDRILVITASRNYWYDATKKRQVEELMGEIDEKIYVLYDLQDEIDLLQIIKCEVGSNEEAFVIFMTEYMTLSVSSLKEVWDNLPPSQQRRITAGIADYGQHHDNTAEVAEFIRRLNEVAA